MATEFRIRSPKIRRVQYVRKVLDLVPELEVAELAVEGTKAAERKAFHKMRLDATGPITLVVPGRSVLGFTLQYSPAHHEYVVRVSALAGSIDWDMAVLFVHDFTKMLPGEAYVRRAVPEGEPIELECDLAHLTPLSLEAIQIYDWSADVRAELEATLNAMRAPEASPLIRYSTFGREITLTRELIEALLARDNPGADWAVMTERAARPIAIELTPLVEINAAQKRVIFAYTVEPLQQIVPHHYQRVPAMLAEDPAIAGLKPSFYLKVHGPANRTPTTNYLLLSAFLDVASAEHVTVLDGEFSVLKSMSYREIGETVERMLMGPPRPSMHTLGTQYKMTGAQHRKKAS